jgi:hypothetical protein
MRWLIRRWWTGCLIGLTIGLLSGWFVGERVRERFRSLERRVSALEKQIAGPDRAGQHLPQGGR